MNVDPDDVDIHRFERFVIAGGQALDGDNPAHALELVDAAVRLWRRVALHAVAVYAARVGRPDEAARLRGGAAVSAPLWPLFERRYGELVGVRSANSVSRSRPRWRRVPFSTSAVSVRSPRPSWRSDELTSLEAHLS